MEEFKRYKKKEIIAKTEDLCDLLESGCEKEFFEQLGKLLKERVVFGTLHPVGVVFGERGLKQPKLYFKMLDHFFKKDHSFDFRKEQINTEKLKMGMDEIRKAKVLGWRAALIGLAFNQMSIQYPEKVVTKTREYLVFGNHWSCADTFADKTFNSLFKNNFDYLFNVLKEWMQDENKWLRNTAAFSIHAPVKRKLISKEQTIHLFSLFDFIMTDEDENVKRKVAWSLREISKVYPQEVFVYLQKWAENNNKTSRWIIKSAAKLMDANMQYQLQTN